MTCLQLDQHPWPAQKHLQSLPHENESLSPPGLKTVSLDRGSSRIWTQNGLLDTHNQPAAPVIDTWNPEDKRRSLNLTKLVQGQARLQLAAVSFSPRDGPTAGAQRNACSNFT